MLKFWEMSYEIAKLEERDWPPLLKEINDPPKQLYYAGAVPDPDQKLLCVVGSRKYSSYGKEACEYLISGLRGQPITIVSGLALGIDSIAHRSALKNKLQTIAVPGSGIDTRVLHPQSHVELAKEIVYSGSTVMSEFDPKSKSATWNFPQRNRIMAGMSHAILIIEAELKSGTLITGRFASEYNRELLVVPGSIFAPNSEGPNMLLRLGATVIRGPEDILDSLDLNTSSGLTSRLPPDSKSFRAGPLSKGKQINAPRNYSDCSPNEIKILEFLTTPLERDELVRRSGLKTSEIQTLLTLLELKGHIHEHLGEIGLV